MEEINHFLESSTIHGLVYIATTKRFVKFLWILIVIAGFTGAGVLIYQSFEAWKESPVKTTIETLPITKLKLPKVIVCPPKDTFTDLNYDILMAENVTLDQKTRDELTDLALQLLWDQLHEETMTNLDQIEDKNRYHNWYKGITEIKLPTYDSANGLTYIVNTHDTSGNISTKYFGNKFTAQNVERKANFTVNIHLPKEILENKTFTLHMKVEKVSMSDLNDGFDILRINYKYSIWKRNSYIQDFNPPSPYNLKKRYVKLLRDVSEEDIMNTVLTQMPGFRLSWSYTSTDNVELTPSANYLEKASRIQFDRKDFKLMIKPMKENSIYFVFWLFRYNKGCDF